MAPRARPAGTLHTPAPGASEQIARQLRRHLEERRLRPGDRIGTEQGLADEFGVSRPTLREALRLLSASQLIRVGRGRSGGIFVARTPNEGMSRNLSETIGLMLAAESVSMEELLDARLSLEVPLAGRAAVNADEGVVARLEGRRGRRRAPPGHAALQRGRRALPPDPRRDGGQRPPARPDPLDPRGPPAHPGRAHRRRGGRRGDPRPAPGDLRAVRRHQRGAAERAMSAHIAYLIEVLEGLRAAR